MVNRFVTCLVLISLAWAASASAQRRKPMRTSANKSVLLPNKSPLITFRILFMTGSAFDPKGKEGLASLTAAMMAEGGTRKLSYDQILEEMYPLVFGLEGLLEMQSTLTNLTPDSPGGQP